MEIFEVSGLHVFSGKEFRMYFLVRRRKGQRPIDALLDVMDLGGVHINNVSRVPANKLPRVIALRDVK